jgi:hypothetical protein
MSEEPILVSSRTAQLDETDLFDLWRQRKSPEVLYRTNVNTGGECSEVLSPIRHPITNLQEETRNIIGTLSCMYGHFGCAFELNHDYTPSTGELHLDSAALAYILVRLSRNSVDAMRVRPRRQWQPKISISVHNTDGYGFLYEYFGRNRKINSVILTFQDTSTGFHRNAKQIFDSQERRWSLFPMVYRKIWKAHKLSMRFSKVRDLSTVFNIVNHAGGAIRITPALCGGARFDIEFPFVSYDSRSI